MNRHALCAGAVYIYNSCYVNILQVTREAITAGIAQFTLASQLQRAIEENEHYPPSFKCRVRYSLSEAERTVQNQLTIALDGAPFAFSYDIMQGKLPY